MLLSAFVAMLALDVHHSSLGLYDIDRIIEIEGTVTSVLWRNPHPSHTV